jgi:acyl carrier protein
VSGNTAMSDVIRRLVGEFAGLSIDAKRLAVNDDLFAAGMTSHASVNLLLALENEFEVEFPDHLLTRAVFESIRSLSAAIEELKSPTAV